MLKINELYGGKQYIADSIKNDILFKIRCCIPGIVQSYDPVKNVAEIQPAVRELVLNEERVLNYVNLPLLINVPIVFPSTSSCSISFPIDKNDEVLVLFTDLSFDNFWLKGSIQNPVENRRHDLSDGIAIPCNLSLSKGFSNEGYLTIKNEDCKIQFKDGDIKFITSSSSVSIDEIYNYIHSNGEG